jgi:hypothetical protein
MLFVGASSALFMLFAVATTQLTALRSHSPWQDDPYDLVVSFTAQLVPALGAITAARTLTCRSRQPLPASRLVELARAADVLVAAVVVTAACDWVAVARGAGTSSWDTATSGLVAALVLVSATAACSLAHLVRAHRLLRADGVLSQAPGPDWLRDLHVALPALTARAPGIAAAVARRTAGAVARADAPDGLRRHRLAVAAAIACAAGLALSVWHTIAEGIVDESLGMAFRVTLIYAAIGALGNFVVLLLAGGYVRLLRDQGHVKSL